MRVSAISRSVRFLRFSISGGQTQELVLELGVLGNKRLDGIAHLGFGLDIDRFVFGVRGVVVITHERFLSQHV